MKNFTFKTIPTLLAVPLLFACSHTPDNTMQAPSQQTPSTQTIPEGSFSVHEISCWDILTLEDEQDMHMAFMLVYGFSHGLKDSPVHSTKVIENSFEKAILYCEAHPDDTAIKAFSE